MVLAQQTLKRVEATERREAWHMRIRSDLMDRDIAAPLCDSIARELVARARFDSLTHEAYEAMIEGAVLACGARAPQPSEVVPSDQEDPSRVREIERMMEAFAGELHKLDESLEVLSAYVQRMRKAPQPDREPESPHRGRQTLH